MLYYGDRSERVDSRAALDRIVERFREIVGLAPPARVGPLEALLADAGMFAQGVADAAPDRDPSGGEPGSSSGSAADALRLCSAVATAFVAALDAESATGEARGRRPPVRGSRAAARLDQAAGALEVARSAAETLRERGLPDALELRLPEGFAHYAVYPESYVRAAVAVPAAGPWTVVGIRSIGTSLGAAVAAALHADHLDTVRPSGSGHDRAVALPAALRARARGGGAFAVVDEGPGMSGNSFMSVARALSQAGAPSDRIHLFPSHGGAPGPAATCDTRRRWARAPRHVVTLDDLALGGDAQLRRWFAGVVPEDTTVDDLSAGAWRRVAIGDAAEWPAVFAQQERRKFLLSCGGERWIAEFAGIGAVGLRRLRLAEAFGPGGRPRLCRGFVVRRWVDGVPLGRGSLPRGEERARFVHQVASYLVERSRCRAAAGLTGASPDQLWRMLSANAGEALGEGARAAADELRLRDRLDGAEPVLVDGKLEPWEWLRTRDGRFVKTDAFQHAEGHDLIGPQPIHWDVAGAIAELDLSTGERDLLIERVVRGDAPRGRAARTDAHGWLRALRFYSAAYAAHRLGRWTFALATTADPDDRRRVEGELARWRSALTAALRG